MGEECSQVLHDVWLFLDNEMDPNSRQAVQQHLDGCSPCLEVAGLESKLKELLARKCGGDRAPNELRERLITALTAVRAHTAGVTTTYTQVTRVTVSDR